MQVRPLLLSVLLPFAAAGADRATDHNFHGWFAYFGDHPIAGSKWGVHLEGQFRRHDVVVAPQQLLLRPAVNYQASRKVMLTAGYAFALSHTYSDYAAPASAVKEHRIWEQAWFRYGSERLRWSTRLRLEHRFIGSPGSAARSSYRFENRLRAWQQVTLPVSRRFYLTAYDEVWFYLKPYVSRSAFDQNRAYVAVGTYLKPTLRFEAAYMNQALLQRSGVALEQNHTLVFSLFSTARLFGR